MPDIRYRQEIDFPRYQVDLDWFLNPENLLDDTLALQSAVIVALGTDALAGPDDVLPYLENNDEDRRGWWGDLDAEEIWGGWPIGSRLWLLERAKITPPGAEEGSTLSRAENYTREAILPFVTHGIASSFTVTGLRKGLEEIDVQLTIYRGPLPNIELRYSELWQELQDL